MFSAAKAYLFVGTFLGAFTALAEESEVIQTPHHESFTTGEVTPTPPPEGEPADEFDTPDRDPDSNQEYDPSFGAISDDFRFGLTGALEVPHIINVGLDTLLFRKFGLSFNRGHVTRNINGIDVSMEHTDLRFRYHPWEGSFFGGVALGQHTMKGEKTREIAYSGKKVSTKMMMTSKANYITPHMGWFAIWEPGFTMGLDVGWMIPQKATTSTDDSFKNITAGDESSARSSADYAKLKSDLEDAVESTAKKGALFVTMIRVGWMF